jgi:hypothetical protein
MRVYFERNKVSNRTHIYVHFVFQIMIDFALHFINFFFQYKNNKMNNLSHINRAVNFTRDMYDLSEILISSMEIYIAYLRT